MRTKLLNKKIKYDGSQLRSHWIYETTGLLGSAALAYMGPCHVELENMVDLVDKKNQDIIYSESMLHFQIEIFESYLESVIWIQRYFLAIIYEELLLRKAKKNWCRIGDDIFLGDKKLSVSIATCSPVSGLIHIGINIISKNTPVPTISLRDLRINPKEFATHILTRWSQEMNIAQTARVKVKAVP